MNELAKLPRVAYPPELKILTEEARARVLAAQRAQDYYDGRFWRYIKQEEVAWAGNAFNIPERNTGHDYHNARGSAGGLDYVPTKLELRYPKYFIDELASWMFENPVLLEEPDERYYAEIERVHVSNKFNQKLLQSATEGCLTGGVAAKVLYNPAVDQTRVIWVSSRECFPVPNPDDIDAPLEKVHFCALRDDERTVWRQTFWMQDGVCFVEEALFDLDKIGESSEPVPKRVIRPPGPLYRGDRPIDFLPVVVIPNEPDLGALFGASDLEPLYQPINEVCRKFSDAGDALKFELFPIKLILNVEESNVNSFEVAPGAVWGLEGGDPDHPPDAKNLESSMSTMEYLYTYVDKLLDACHQFSGVPRHTREKLDSSGPLSGVALKLMYTSIVSACNRKLMYWLPSLRDVYDYALRTEAVYHGLSYDPEELGLEVRAVPRVPQNELEQLEIQAAKIRMLVKKTVDVMKESGVENPEGYLAEVLNERAEIERATNPDYMFSRIEGEAHASAEDA